MIPAARVFSSSPSAFPSLSPGDSSSWKGGRVRRGGPRFLVCFSYIAPTLLFYHRTAQVQLSGRPGARSSPLFGSGRFSRSRDVFGKVKFCFSFCCVFKIIVSNSLEPISRRLHGVTTYSGEYGCISPLSFFWFRIRVKKHVYLKGAVSFTFLCA